ncbi:hypothetical protein UG55_100927 [Frankia sp. EI5c]|uniref:AMIN-like domain-containing (lipo)protein n=1 Tax=Frankia sp. EI5c TaxID=683316 RepID=UPI0007C2DCE1|nr:hypothetical protein [Frankia sp. EI5c]OAA27144.1 hypothetical protein UG55_100927 [Frankia sp. EI5c]
MQRSPLFRRRGRPVRPARTGALAVLSVLLCVGLAACAGGDGPDTDEPPTASSTAGPATPGDPAASSGTGGSSGIPSPAGQVPPGDVPSGGAAPNWETGQTRVERQITGAPQLVALRSARNQADGAVFDRLVLEFRGGLPGYTAGYVDEVVRPGSGAPLPLTGAVTFEMVMMPAAAHDDAGEPTLTTPRTGGGLPMLVSYVLAGDFEGYVHVGAGLDRRTGYRVIELRNPDRLVIDFRA